MFILGFSGETELMTYIHIYTSTHGRGGYGCGGREIKRLEGISSCDLETEKSQDLQLACWRPRKASGLSSGPKAGRLKTQKEPVFQFKSNDRKRPTSQLKTVRKELLLT